MIYHSTSQIYRDNIKYILNIALDRDGLLSHVPPFISRVHQIPYKGGDKLVPSVHVLYTGYTGTLVQISVGADRDHSLLHRCEAHPASYPIGGQVLSLAVKELGH